MNPLFTHHPATNLNTKSYQHLLVSNHEHDYNTSEGSEFIDDAIRMEEQPLIPNEESIAASKYEHLL